MENFYDVIDMIESTYEIKLMNEPYTFNPKPFHNMDLDKQLQYMQSNYWIIWK